jgi:diacylglycerol kinase (ATP)
MLYNVLKERALLRVSTFYLGLISLKGWKNGNLLDKSLYSFNGLRAAFVSERAIKQELLVSASLTVFSVYRRLPAHRVAMVLLVSLIPLIAELINTAVETLADLQFGPIYREDVKRAKDMLSASVLVALIAGYGLSLIIIFF